MKVLVTLVLAVLQVTRSYSYDPECPFPPGLWCSSHEIATACQVTEQCSRTQWSPVLDKAPLVNLSLYYETGCPGCQDFILHQLYPAFQAIGGIFNITLVPYGNAEEKQIGHRWVFTCQHGKDECIGNILETCTLNILSNITAAFPFVHCMEEAMSKHMRAKQAFAECTPKFPAVPAHQVQTCSMSTKGNRWEHEMALKTEYLDPPSQYVPWITLNGIHTEKINNEAMNNLIKLLCDTYTGTKPPGCNKTTRRCLQ